MDNQFLNQNEPLVVAPPTAAMAHSDYRLIIDIPAEIVQVSTLGI